MEAEIDPIPLPRETLRGFRRSPCKLELSPPPKNGVGTLIHGAKLTDTMRARFTQIATFVIASKFPPASSTNLRA